MHIATEESVPYSTNNNTLYPQTSHAAEITAAQIELLFQQNKFALSATLIMSTVFVIVFWDIAEKKLLLSWLTAVYLLTLVRFFLTWCYFRSSPSIEKSITWGRLFVLGVIFSGTLWGAAGGIFFERDSLVHQLFIAYLLGGMVSGAMSTLSSHKGIFLLFSILVVSPFTFQAIVHGNDSTHIAIALTFWLFLIMMAGISRQLYNTITDSLRLRFDNIDLVNNLLKAKDHQKTINMKLHEQIVEKDKVKEALQKTKEQLEQRVKERTEELAQSNATLYQEKELFRITLASIGDAVITCDSCGKLTYLNPTAEQLTGWHNNEANGLTIQQVLHIEHIVTQKPISDPVGYCLNKINKKIINQDCLLIRKDRHKYIIDYSVAPIHDEQDKMIGMVLTFRDVTEQRKLTQKLAYQAAHDSLTGLLNRDEFETRLTKVLSSAHQGNAHALLFLDLDQFKIVNDTFGHGAGDKLLQQVTALLHSKLRTRDTLARLGGDEFGIILEHCPQKEALRIAYTLRKAVQEFRYHWNNNIVAIGVSIGLFPIDRNNISLSEAMCAADRSCYAAKEGGRNRVYVFQANDSLLQKRSGEMRWLHRIKLAMTEHRLNLYLQPIFPICKNHGHEQHGEILLRLEDEQGKLILPGAFLPSVERYDRMIMIDQWVVKQSLKLLRCTVYHWPKATYAINLSAQALSDENFLDFVADHIKSFKHDPSGICFEITENVALADLEHVTKFVLTLKDLGCRFSMDDFGSGLSSFSYLKNLPLDYLKIDGRLVKDMATDQTDHAMVRAIHNIGQVLGLKTIAEWVENEKTMQLLKQMEVDYAQGFWLAKPRLLNRIE